MAQQSYFLLFTKRKLFFCLTEFVGMLYYIQYRPVAPIATGFGVADSERVSVSPARLDSLSRGMLCKR